MAVNNGNFAKYASGSHTPFNIAHGVYKRGVGYRRICRMSVLLTNFSKARDEGFGLHEAAPAKANRLLWQQIIGDKEQLS